MRITVIGAGAVGGVTGAYLTQAGYDVTLVDNVREHVEVMNRSGLTITGARGEHTFRVKAALPHEITADQQMVILAVKAMHTEDALRPVLPFMGPDSFVLSMQNGLEEETIASIVGATRTVGCFLQFGADYLEPGRVLLAYDFPVYVGEIDGRVTDRIHTIAEIMSHVMPVIVTDNIWGYLWAKMCLGSVYFAGALTKERFRDLLGDSEFRPLFAQIVQETGSVAQAHGVKLERFKGFDPNLFMVSSPRELGPAYAQWEGEPEPGSFEANTLKPYTGIQRDIIVRKRRTEVDHQPGMVVKKARDKGVPVPLNTRIVEMIHEVEDGKRALGKENLRELHGR